MTQPGRNRLRKAIAIDIYRVAQAAPMTLTADGGELATVLAELILRRVEDQDTDPISFGPASGRPGSRS